MDNLISRKYSNCACLIFCCTRFMVFNFFHIVLIFLLNSDDFIKFIEYKHLHPFIRTFKFLSFIAISHNNFNTFSFDIN